MLRNELRAFMAEMRSKDQHIAVLERQIERLEKQNAQLHDRLMSMDFVKFKTYEEPVVVDLNSTGEASVWGDESLAGQIVEDETQS